jgi:polygalacturonase
MYSEEKTRRSFIRTVVAGTALSLPPILWSKQKADLTTYNKSDYYQALVTGTSYAGLFYDVRKFGAVGDGKTLASPGIQEAIDEASIRGGGMVIVPPGSYLSGALFMRSNVHLHIMAGATLSGSHNFYHYPAVDGIWEGIRRKVYSSIITGHDLENVSITGRGVIDGQGELWWQAHHETREVRRVHGIATRPPENPPGSPLKWPRPRIINLYNCKNVLISGLKIVDSPSWTIHPVYCENVSIEDLTIIVPYESPNTDGINPDSSKNVRIANCYVDCGDDCVTIKSGYNEFGREVGIPCENIVVTNCTFLRGRGGVVVGSEMSGDVRNIVVSNCTFDGTLRGLRIKTGRGRGGIVENFHASNCVMREIGDAAFSITMFYGDVESTPQDIDEGIPTIKDVYWSDIIVSNSNKTADFRGLPESPIQNLTLQNIEVKSAESGIECSSAKNFVLDNVRIDSKRGPSFILKDTEDLEMHRITSYKPHIDAPVIILENVKDALLQSSKAVEGTGTFIEVKGSKTREIIFHANRLKKAKNGVVFSGGATERVMVTI